MKTKGNLMLINKLNALYTPILKTNNCNKRFNNTLTNDVFVRTTSFKGNEKQVKDDKSFEAFQEWSEKSGFLNDIEEISERTGKILGSGFEGEVIEIPNNDNWVIKSFKRSNLSPVSIEQPTINKINDISPELNIGQSIAYVRVPVGKNYSKMYYILKRQTGKSLGISKTSNSKVSEYNSKTHINSLRMIANAPQSTYNKFVKDVQYITKQGYMLDYINPNNLMYDESKQEINFVDVEDKLNENKNQYAEMLFCLLDSEYADRYITDAEESDEKEEVRQLTESIVNKYFEAMHNNGFKFDDSNILKLLLKSDVLSRNVSGSTSDEKIEALKSMGLYQ